MFNLRPLGYYLLFIWIVGTFLNASVLYVFVRYKNVRQTSTNLFIGGLILADFFGVALEIPLPALSHLTCRWLFAYVGCVVQSVIAYFAGCSNMYMLCLVSIDRYLVVTKSFPSARLSIKQTYVTILCAYILALFWTLMPLIGWSAYDYEGTGASCSIKWEDRSLSVISYNITILVFVYLIPVIIIIGTNIRVLNEISYRRRQTNMNLNDVQLRRQLYIDRRVAHTVILIIGGFLLAWTPYAITVVIRIVINGKYFPPIFGTIPAVFAKTSLAWNPFIYIVRNRNFRVYLPFCSNSRLEQRKRLSDTTRYSIYPYTTVHLPLASRTTTTYHEN